jgi:hypothetical protein
MVTMRTLPVVLDDAGAERDSKRLIPTCHVRMPWQPLTGRLPVSGCRGNGGENNCRRREIWLSRKLDEARSSWDNQSGWHGAVATHELTFFHQHEYLKLSKNS